MEACPHLREPSEAALQALRDPLKWSCHVCSSTDGAWCCLGCGHVGCGRRAHLPALGGGHSKHHYQMSAGLSVDRKSESSDDDNNMDGESSSGGDKVVHDNIDDEGGVHHEVCFDIVSRAVHCYVCDDYVLSDAPWLASLRSELEVLETCALEQQDSDNMESEGCVEASKGKRIRPVPGIGRSITKVQRMLFDPGLKQIGCTGLQNLGNTCYMNSVIQALVHCSGFRSFFLDFLRAAAPLTLPSGRGKLKRDTTVRLGEALQLNKPHDPNRLALCEVMHALLRVLWSGRWRSFSPHSFVWTIWDHGGVFAARRQQDAQEFLGFVLDQLDEELRAEGQSDAPEVSADDSWEKVHAVEEDVKVDKDWELVANAETETNQETNEAKAKDEKGSKGKTPSLGVMGDIFGVEECQKVRCDGCGTVTERAERQLGLVLSLPDENSESKKDNGKTRSTTKAIPLSACFDNLCKSERLVGPEQFYCDTCEGKQDATRNVSFRRRPQALVLSFRRTRWSLKRGLHKDARKVKFPLDLDATELLVDGKNLSISNGEDMESDDKCHYRLASVISHFGSSPQCGHYVAWAQVKDKWYLFNDSIVCAASESQVLQSEAFILLYERHSKPRTTASSE